MSPRDWLLYLVCSLIVAGTFGVGMLVLWWIERRRLRVDDTDRAGC